MRKDPEATPAERATAKRREFLRLAGVGTVGGAAATLAGRVADADVGPSDRQGGYRETAHVKKAYQLARF